MGNRIQPFLYFFFLSLIFLGSFAFANSPEFRFGLIADVQYADQESSQMLHYRASPDKLKEAVQTFNERDLSFVIQLGDLIDNNFESFDQILPIWNQIKTEKKHVLGNHDYEVSSDKLQEVSAKLELSKNYYSFKKGNWRFFVLDGNEISFHAHKKESPKHKQAVTLFNEVKNKKQLNALPYNGGMSTIQLDWLKEKLSQSCSNSEKVIIFSHFPIYPEHKTNLWNADTLREVLEAHDCVLAYINGHNHIGGYGIKKGIHYVSLQGVVETPDSNAYAIAEVYEDHIKIRGFGREKSRILKPGAPDFQEPFPDNQLHEKAPSKQPHEITPLAESRAYKRYSNRPKSELSKLIFLIDRFKDMGVRIRYDGLEYDANYAARITKKYLARRYRRENAKEWVQKHSYRSIHAGEIIYVIFPDGSEEALREVFISELNAVEKLSG